jgi:carbamoyl-phosphate synthase small subunit
MGVDKKGTKASLVLNDGSSFSGFSFGAPKPVAGEVVFNTGMVGYPEAFTDPSYRGQILVLTYPLIGNYGVPGKEIENGLLKNFESDRIHIAGLVISDYSKDHNHWNAKSSLSDWLKEQGIPAIYGVDTRMLTKKLREKGVMLGKIQPDGRPDIGFEDPNARNLVAEVSTGEPLVYNGGKKRKIVLIDGGVKYNIIRSLLQRGVTVIRVPWDHDFFGMDFDGVMISNGPGDPKMCRETIANIRRLIDGKIPTFGVCLGNQLLALAAGADTYKLKYGHRSQNQPCKEIGSRRCYITTQNHGFAVDTKTLPAGWKPRFENANDGTNEGIIHESGRFFSVQFHPEATPGPLDTGFLFDRFLEAVETFGRKS